MHMWHRGFIPCKAVLLTAGLGQLPQVPLKMEGALPRSPSAGQRGFSAVDYSGGEIIIQVCILKEGYCSVLFGGSSLSETVMQCVGMYLFSILEGQVAFHLPAAGRQAQHTDLFGACVHVGFFVWCFFFFERTVLWRPTANPKFGIPDITMRKQTFLHLK